MYGVRCACGSPLRLLRLANLLLVLLLVGCGPAAYRWVDESYIVRRGDTLYSIAFDNNLDYRTLAQWNNIAPPYTIYPGQQIRLMPSGPYAQPRPQRAEVAKAAQRSPPKTAPATPSAPAPTSSRTAAAPVSKWLWPAQGRLLQVTVPGTDPKGLNIGGKVGEPVRAAASGYVVYGGNGLKGYGLLLIVKHNEHYLSAYGHNSRLDVHEGDRVHAGQVIARMGLGPQRQPMLHFEIRRDGKPVNPRRLLPPRKK